MCKSKDYLDEIIGEIEDEFIFGRTGKILMRSLDSYGEGDNFTEEEKRHYIRYYLSQHIEEMMRRLDTNCG